MLTFINSFFKNMYIYTVEYIRVCFNFFLLFGLIFVVRPKKELVRLRFPTYPVQLYATQKFF